MTLTERTRRMNGAYHLARRVLQRVAQDEDGLVSTGKGGKNECNCIDPSRVYLSECPLCSYDICLKCRYWCAAYKEIEADTITECKARYETICIYCYEDLDIEHDYFKDLCKLCKYAKYKAFYKQNKRVKH